MAFDLESLQDILVCPKSKAPLVLHEEALVSSDPETRLQYAIRDEIPVLLVEEAVEIPIDQWSKIMAAHGCDPETGAKLAE